MNDSILPQFLSYYPWACVVLALTMVFISGISFIGVLMCFHRALFKHERFRYDYSVEFLIAAFAACHYYELFGDMDSTLPQIMVDPTGAALSMTFSLFIPAGILAAVSVIMARLDPQESLIFGNAVVKKGLKSLFHMFGKDQNQGRVRKIAKKAGQHLALIIGDNESTNHLAKRCLEKEHFIVVESQSGSEGLSMAAFNYPDLVILDMALRDMEGALILSRLREWTQAPVIILTADMNADEAAERSGIDHDHYLSKPFQAEDLTENIRIALRHLHHNHQQKDRSIYQTSIFKLDRGTRTLMVRKKEVHLTPHEYHLLSYLISHAGRIVTLKMIHQEFWGRQMDEDSLRQYIHKLRYKIELDPVVPKYILTEPGLGYRLHHR
jgi:two-component system KDP operon response regulator KdpE